MEFEFLEFNDIFNQLSALQEEYLEHKNAFESVEQLPDADETRFRLALVLELMPKFKKRYRHLHERVEKKGEFESYCAPFMSTYISVIAKMKRAAGPEPSPHLESTRYPETPSIKVKLPDFKLPEFDGSLEKWLTWRGTFESMIHRNESLSDVVKYHYLRSSMKLPAGHQNVLDNYSVNELSYQAAWAALCERYDDKRKLKSQLFNSLLSVKKMTGDTPSEVRRMLDTFSSIVTSMDLLECSYDDLLVHVVQFRFDDVTSREWQKFIGKEEATFGKMKEFLTEFWHTIDAIPSQAKRPQQQTHKQNDNRQSSSKSFAASTSSAGCALCKEAHLLHQCRKFLLLSVPERYSVVNDNRLCRNCFAPTHIQRNCKSIHRCRICKMNHHTMLHSEKSSSSSSTPEVQQQQSSQQSKLNPNVNLFTPTPPPRITYPMKTLMSKVDLHSAEFKSFPLHSEALLGTVNVLVLSKAGQWIPCRALMDSGSQSNYITTSFAKLLAIDLVRSSIAVTGVNGQMSKISHVASPIVASRYREFTGAVQCCVSDDITGFLPPRPIDVSKLKIPECLFLADPEFYKPGQIEMLLGTGVHHSVQLGNILRPKNSPVLMETEFGWTVGGNFPVSSSSSSNISCFSQFPNSGLEELDKKLDKFIELEHYGTHKKIYTREEKYCEDSFVENTTQDIFGRLHLFLPFKSNITNLGNNFANANSQYFAQEKKRANDIEYNKLYVDYMNEYIQSGHMSEVDASTKHEGYYLPHHGVKKISSTTTKLRPVCNGASKSETGLCLNDCLCTGPTVQPDLIDIILRFREHRYVYKSDCEKMYRQFFITPEHRKFQKILWRSSPFEPIKHYELNTVTFGQNSSSFLATRSLNRIADENAERFPQAAEIIKSSFYVDDLLFSFNSIEEGLKLRDNIRDILISSCVPLRKWSANHPDLLKGLSQKDVEVAENESTIIKALGIVWKPDHDVISFAMKPLGECPTTKAGVLSEIASIFNPLGIIGPVVLFAKLHMKPLRLLGWNDKLHEDDIQHWQEFRLKFSALKNFSLQRHTLVVNPVKIQLHGFSDASESAFGAAVYAWSSDSSGHIQVSLTCSKSRVSPPKQKSIARLELCAAVLLSKLIARILKVLTVDFSNVILWSDSMIVLYWIATESSKLSTFVGNRVSVIQELMESCSAIWRHIPGSSNPADHISRGLNPDEIESCELWWNGPSFLKAPSTRWPESLITINDDDTEIYKESRKTFLSVQNSSLFVLIEKRFSSLRKLVNCFAYILRFAVKKLRSSEIISIQELEDATYAIVRIIQQHHFPSEYSCLLKAKEDKNNFDKFPSNSPLLAYSPFMDTNNIIRVGGRVRASSGLTQQQKHQILLPKCHFVKLVVRDMHKKFMHPGQSAMLSHVREYYWPLGVKHIIKEIQRECILCFRTKPKFLSQIMGDLPNARVTMTSPFLSTAVDYAGSFAMRSSLTKKSSIVKVYVALFKCMATGAIHLEAVTALSTAGFIATFDRFISRRGFCCDIFSDNGTEFVGANNEFQRILKETEQSIGEFLKEKSIHWHFTTPIAPHAGGYYESGIKSMKHHLVRECANRSFDYEQFSTLLCKIEAIINSRPLTPMSEDPNDLEALTPAHFLIGRTMIAKPERNFLPVHTNRLDRFNQLQQLQQLLWDRWYHEYLHQLQTRPNHFRQKNEFFIGDMVLVKDNNLPPLKWMMGRIIQMFPDKKGIVRNVLVKTATGEKHRHIRYLAFLPIEKDSSLPGGECSATE